jgi:hypothetical protein
VRTRGVHTDDGTENYGVVDGQQRLRTILQFIGLERSEDQTEDVNRFALDELPHLHPSSDRTDDVRDRAIGFREGGRGRARLRNELLRRARNSECCGKNGTNCHSHHEVAHGVSEILSGQCPLSATNRTLRNDGMTSPNDPERTFKIPRSLQVLGVW